MITSFLSSPSRELFHQLANIYSHHFFLHIESPKTQRLTCCASNHHRILDNFASATCLCLLPLLPTATVTSATPPPLLRILAVIHKGALEVFQWHVYDSLPELALWDRALMHSSLYPDLISSCHYQSSYLTCQPLGAGIFQMAHSLASLSILFLSTQPLVCESHLHIWSSIQNFWLSKKTIDLTLHQKM